MKRLLVLLLALLMVVSCSSCEVLWYLLESAETEPGPAPIHVVTDTEPAETRKPGAEPIETEPGADPPATKRETEPPVTEPQTEVPPQVEKGKYYYDLEHVILYLYTFGELPDNYISKSYAEDNGWIGGSVEKIKKGGAIGGDYFGNFEGQLPKKSKRKYTECDIDTKGKSKRGEKRLIFSNDGLFFYTEDHYESFTEYIVKNGKVIKK